MQQSCPYGSVRGAAGDRRPYRDEMLHGLREHRELASRVRDAEKAGEFPLSLRLMRKLASALSQPVAFRHGLLDNDGAGPYHGAVFRGSCHRVSRGASG